MSTTAVLRTNAENDRPAIRRTLLVKLVVAVGLVMVAGGFYYFFGDRLSIDDLAEQELTLRRYQQEHPIRVFVGAFLVYVLVTGLSIPGAAALSLFMGWYFRFAQGFVLVSFAAACGATVAFLLSRYFLREPIQRRFGDRLKTFNAALDREGAFYLFTLRLVPVVPFFVINVVMGLTRIRTWTFWWVSQVGMLAGTCVYIYAGSTLPSLTQLADPSQLRPADVRDWSGLIDRVAVAGSRSGDSSSGESTIVGAGPAARIQAALPSEIAEQLQSPAAATDEELRRQVVLTVNRLLQQPDFSLAADWHSAVRPPAPSEAESADQKRRRRQDEKRLTKVNRDLLVAAWPDLISPPQPILSKQLLAAFVALGLFPIAVKKTLGRWRRRGVAS